MRKFALIICFSGLLILSSCTQYNFFGSQEKYPSNQEEINNTNNIILREKISPDKIESSEVSGRQNDCSSLNKGIPRDKLFNFSYKYAYQHGDYDLVFITCLDEIESKIKEKNEENYNSFGNIQSLILMKKSYIEEIGHSEYNSNFIRLPFFGIAESGKNYITHYANHNYLLAFSDDFKFQHVIDINFINPEQSRIVYTFPEEIQVIEITPQGIIFTGVLSNTTGIDNSRKLSFFSFGSLENISIGSVGSYVVGIYDNERVLYFIRSGNTALKKGKIKNFVPRKIEVDLFRYIPSKNELQSVKKVAIFTNYQEHAEVLGDAGEYLDYGLGMWTTETNGENNTIFLDKKIIFEG